MLNDDAGIELCAEWDEPNEEKVGTGKEITGAQLSSTEGFVRPSPQSQNRERID